MNDTRRVLFYDGVCKFCNQSVNFLIKLDKAGRISYSALQGDLAKSVLSVSDRVNLDTLVYAREGKFYRGSSAVIFSLSDTSVWMKWVHIFRVIPTNWRDGLYALVARNRYRWFGSYDSCMVPAEHIRQRFIP